MFGYFRKYAYCPRALVNWLIERTSLVPRQGSVLAALYHPVNATKTGTWCRPLEGF